MGESSGSYTHNKYMKKYSISLTIREMHTKTMLRFYLNPVRMAVIKKTTTNAGEDVGGIYIPGGNINYCSHYGNHYGSSLKK
jgi:hypothetical protein